MPLIEGGLLLSLKGNRHFALMGFRVVGDFWIQEASCSFEGVEMGKGFVIVVSSNEH